MLDHVGQATLGDLEGGEGQHSVAEGPQVELGPEPADHPPALELVEAGLHRAPGHFQAAGQLEHPRPRALVEGGQQAGVEVVDGGGHHDHIVAIFGLILWTI